MLWFEILKRFRRGIYFIIKLRLNIVLAALGTTHYSQQEFNIKIFT